MNILQINSGTGWSGGQYQVLLLSRGLRERGHHVVVACPPGSALAEKASKEGLSDLNSGTGWSGGQYQVLLLSRGLRERGHHVVVACPPGSALAEKASKEGL